MKMARACGSGTPLCHAEQLKCTDSCSTCAAVQWLLRLHWAFTVRVVRWGMPVCNCADVPEPSLIMHENW